MKKTLKKLISAGLATALLGSATLASVSQIALAVGDSALQTSDDSTFDDGTLTYTVGDGYTATISGCTSSTISVTITEKVDGYSIVGIDDGAFSNCTSLQAITIPKSIESIGEGAFYGCTSLQSVTILSDITELSSGTFAYCTALETVKLPDTLTTIDSMAFSYCAALESIELPESVESIGDYAFMYCMGLENIEIPAKVTALNSGTFYGCTSLESFNIPKTLEDIGNYPFLGCSFLSEITVEDGNENYVVEDSVLFNSDKTTLITYPAGLADTSYTIPDGVTQIASSAFFNANCLEEVNFPDTVEYIGEGAFDFCTSLTSVTIPSSVTQINESAFSDCTALTEVNLSEGLETLGSYAFYNCTSLKSVNIPESVTDIGDYAFGFTESEDETDDDGNYAAVNDSEFIIYGYSSSKAKSFASKNGIKFVSLNFDMTYIVWAIVLIAVCIVIAVIVSRIVHKRLMSKEEKSALAKAEAELSGKEAKEEPEEPYVSILDQEMPHHNVSHSEDSEE